MKGIESMKEKLISKCCECGCEVDLEKVTLTEDYGEPICNNCKVNYVSET